MKAHRRNTNLSTFALYVGLRAGMLSVLCAVLFVSSAQSAEPVGSGAGPVCGTLKTFLGVTQIFDSTRTNLGDVAFGVQIRCGDWVSVESGKAVIQLTSGTTVLVSENTFFQLLEPRSGENPSRANLALYRGEFLVQAKKNEVRVATPNALAKIVNGGAFVVYASSDESTHLVGLGATAALENRFFPGKGMPASFAGVVSFSNPVERLIPDANRPVNSKDLNARLAKIGASPELLAAVEKAVKTTTKNRMPVTLVSTAFPVSVNPKSDLNPNGNSSRPSLKDGEHSISPATLAGKKVPTRSIASRKVVRQKESPNFRLKRPAQEAGEKQKLMQALATIQTEEE